MTQDFLELMKEVAESYNIKVIENAPKGGVFYRNINGELIDLTVAENALIMNDFFNPIKIDAKANESIYILNDEMNWAA